MTLIPVSKICALVSVPQMQAQVCGSEVLFRIDRALVVDGVADDVEQSSQHCFPDGTLIGAPLSIASMPLVSPSVEDRATHLTTSSPICCAASATIPCLQI
jgi:hypothetical protein